MKKIAIQGIKGCFHHVSLIKYLWLNEYEIVECKNFNQLSQAITNREANLGIIAIDNSIIGSIISNYIFLLNHHFKILGSIVLYIEQHLMTFFSRELKFNEILSHPIALQQCDNFIYENTHLRIKNYSDTAIASLYIYKYMFKKKAAIASKLASKEYKLKIIDKNIQNISNNFTRFFLIKPEPLQIKIKENWNISSILLKIKNFLNLLKILSKKKNSYD
jgi:prephenate dehydratase